MFNINLYDMVSRLFYNPEPDLKTDTVSNNEITMKFKKK